MQTVTSAFTTALANNTGIIIAKAELWALGAGAATSVFDVTGGVVTMDRGQTTRRTARITVSNTDSTMYALLPRTTASSLSPFAAYEVRTYRGLHLPDGTDEYVPLGVFRVLDADIEVTVDGTKADLAMVDRSDRVSRARLTDTYIIASGTLVTTAISTLISSRVSGLTYSITPNATTTPRIILEPGQDPWEAAQDLADSIGYELFFSATGVVVLQPVPDPASGSSVYTFNESNANLLGINRRLTRERTANVITVSGESSALLTPVRYTVRDTDPASPTYYLGPFGEVPDFISSPKITTAAQAQAVAEAELLKRKGVIERLRFSGIVHPALEPSDLITVSESTSGAGSVYMLDRFDMPMTGAQMDADTRERGL